MKVVGLGTLCLTSQFLKQLGLKDASMPFDWIFSSPEMIAHAIRDDFKEFLDRDNIEPIPKNHRPHPDLHRANNTFYRDKFGVHFVYNHHEPSINIEDHQYFVRCVERFRALLSGGEKYLFLLFKHLNIDQGNLSLFSYSRLADLLYPHKLLCIEIATNGATVPGYDVIACEGNLEVGRFSATTALTGVSFGSQTDHDAVQVIVQSRMKGLKPAMRPLPECPADRTNTAPETTLEAEPEAMPPKHVDQVTLYRGMLTVDGWSESGPPIILYEGDAIRAWQNQTVRRPDVAQAYGPRAAEWGFSVRALVGRQPVDTTKITLAFPDGSRLHAPDVVKVAASQIQSATQSNVVTPSQKRPLAVVAMAKNEPDFLPIWVRHYTAQAGANNCYILDHASDDGSAHDLDCNVIRLPESPFDENIRAALVSTYCASLLQNYEAVLYTDADEIVVADPRVATSLADYVHTANPPEIVTTIGMDLLHEEGTEPPLDPMKRVLSQRRWVRASHAGCKPAFIRKPYRWGAGFHFVEGSPAFHGLYNFHIAYADMGIAHRRQAKRNRFLPIGGGAHHAADPTSLMDHIRRDTPWDRRLSVDFGGCPTEVAFTGAMQPYSCQQEPVLWSVPERFRAIY